ncbi:MAG: glycosyltransferase [Balneolales bacterium]|nr:glycosyltransferase [Balneolales bacterium]
MKVLYLIPYSPANPTFGGALRIFHLLSHLHKNHDVTVAGFSSAEEETALIDHFPRLAGKTHFVDHPYTERFLRWSLIKSLFTVHSHWHQSTRSKEFQQRLNQLLKNEKFDVIQSEFPVMAMFNYGTSAVKVVDAHNVEYDNFKRMAKVKNPIRKLFFHLEAYKFRREEIAVCAKQDGLLVTSERDISVFNQTVPKVQKYLIPNGVDTNYFRPFKTKPDPHSMVFVGMMKYVPNHDGINYFLDEVFPKILEKTPDATITIVGKNPPQSILNRANKNIIVTGFVEDTRPYIEKSAVYVVPLRMGGGTRLKIMEAMAVKKPIVSTSIGCEGIDVVHGKSILIADSPDDFANRVLQLFQEPELTNELTKGGYELVEHRYKWESIGDQMDQAYQELTHLKVAQAASNGYSDNDVEAIDRWNNESNSVNDALQIQKGY